MNDFNRKAVRPKSGPAASEVSGVLETIASGLSMLLSKPWLLLIPVLVDLVAWLGIQVSGRPLITGMQDLMIEQGGANGPAAAEELGRIGDSFRINDLISSLVPSIFSGLPSDSALNILIGTLVPSASSGIDRGGMYQSWGNGLGEMITPSNGLAVMGWALLFFAAATLILAVFKVPIAAAVRGDTFQPKTLLRDVGAGWLRLLGLIAIVLAAFGILLIPLFVLALVVALFGVNLIALLSLALFVFGSIGALYLFFLLDAMFIYRVGPILAARMSFSVARLNFTDSWRFAAASILLSAGVMQVWNLLVANPPGIFISLISNAALGTGLSIASMMFFHDRARLPRPILPSRSFDPLRRF